MATKKTVTFAVMHFSIAFTVAWLLTGSIVIGGAIALIEPAVNTVAYFFHERIWKKIENRQHAGQEVSRGLCSYPSHSNVVFAENA